MEPEKLTKSYERVHKFGEVFTPTWCVKDMCDMLEREAPDAFEPDRTFLEPACGEGVFLLEILRRKFSRCRRRSDYTTALRSVYAMELQADNVEISIANVTELCGQYIKLSRQEQGIIRDHIIQADSLKVMGMMRDEQLTDGRKAQILKTDYVTEMCPHCENEIDMRWDVGQMGYQAWCPVCGNRLMLCSECADPCDYDSTTDRCRMQNE